MFNNNANKIKFFILFFIWFSGVYAQETLKLGGSSLAINNKAALDVESTTRGFLPPRMTKLQRNAITSPPQALLVWCTDCNLSTDPSSGQFCVYMGASWVPLKMSTTSLVTTQKKADANKPTRTSATAARINGNLVEVIGAVPTETGVVYRSIVGNDFSTLPFLDGTTGAVTSPNVKLATGSPVTKDGDPISVDVTGLGATSYYFRTYAKSFLGIGYGNPVIFNCAAPSLTAPVVTDGTTLYPKFSGTLTVNAGTPAGAITEYGYYSGTTSSPTTNKKVISDAASLATLNAVLNGETFTAHPVVNLTVNDYNVTALGTQYFRFYAVANGTTIYSSDISFSPAADAVTGGTAVATVVSSTISTPVKIEQSSTSTITVTFNVAKAGTYTAFVPGAKSGATTGLSLGTAAAGSFSSTGTQTLTFAVAGTPDISLDGNSWTVPKIGSLSTGVVFKGDITAGKARCYDALYNSTAVVPVVSTTGKVWMDRNLGASRAGTSATDYQAYGCLYQWGRNNDGHGSVNWSSSTAGTAVYGTTSTKATTDIVNSTNFIVSSSSPYDWRSSVNNDLWQGALGINNPCPSGYRLPTSAEFSAEEVAYNMSNSSAAYTSVLKLVAAGSRNSSSGSLQTIGNSGLYWTSSTTVQSSVNYSNRRLYSSIANNAWEYRGFGFSVRCIKDNSSLSSVSVTTAAATSLDDKSFVASGSTVNTGGENITENGFCWSTTNLAPAIENSTSVITAISQNFTAPINSLDANTTYYIRAYVKASGVVVYGNAVTVKTATINSVKPLMTSSQFNTMFPHRADFPDNGAEFYSYQTLVDAVDELKNIKIEIVKRQNSDLTYVDYTYKIKRTDLRTNSVSEHIYGTDYNETWNVSKAEKVTNTVYFSDFLNSGNVANDKKELCAFLANISHETTGGGQVESTKTYGLYFKEEISCITNGCPAYTVASTDYPPAAGKSYHGRGPIQISYNYNYGLSSFLIFGDKNVLLNNPETVLANGKNAFMTAVVFWNMPQGIKPSCHSVVNTSRGFAKTINIINGGVECGASNSAKDPQVQDRIGFYKKFSSDFGLTIGESDTELSCRDLTSY